MSPAPPTPRLRLHVVAAAAAELRAGHPWLFNEKIRSQNRPGKTGELAAVFDPKDRFVGVGLFDPDSPIRARMLIAGRQEQIDSPWWRNRLEQALRRRDGMFDENTTGFRWIYGESDGWPGLVLDKYDRTLVLKIYSGIWLPRLSEIVVLINDRLPNDRIVLRLSRNIQPGARKSFQLDDGQVLSGSPVLGPVVFLESGLRFEADVLRGQKTGFFLDQRENRRHVESFSKGKRVLNAFSYSGGFAVYAARGGARSVTEIDISEHALRAAERNFTLNASVPAIARCRRTPIQADVFDWLSENSKPEFDLIVLDPPALAKKKTERPGALQSYRSLATHALRCLRRGGMLVAASCSAHVTAAEFFEAILDAAGRSGRAFEQIQTTGQPPDHAATFPEAAYLKCIYLRER